MFARKMKKTDPIGMRVKVEPFDSSPIYLPVSGTTTRRISALNNVTNWFVLRPDAPLDYQQQIPPPARTYSAAFSAQRS